MFSCTQAFFRQGEAVNHNNLNLAYDSGFSVQEIADCRARQGLLAMAIELSPVFARSSIADALRFDGPEPAALSLQEVRDVLRQAHELGARRIMLLSDPASGLLEPEVIAFVGELGMELETCPRHPVPTPNGCVLKTSSTGQGCMRHLYSCVVSMQGRVYPCVGVLLPLGNVHDESLRDILRQSEVIENLANHRKLIKGPCRDCPDARDCYGCRGAAFIATGDYLAPDPTCPRVQGVPIDSLPLAVTPLIPHGATIRMVDRLTQVGERQATAEFLVPGTCPFVDTDGRLDATAYVELIVQTLAACHGFHLPSEEQNPHHGLLLGVNNLQITGESRVGDHLKIHVRKTTRFGGFGVVEGVVYHRDGREVARGESKVWQASTDSVGVFG
ncbi:MAG: SPASM domain-containing protein [Planctomycetota bacterium]|jgi:radical SAM protein with 4Fe4S-binding SPASM domain